MGFCVSITTSVICALENVNNWMILPEVFHCKLKTRNGVDLLLSYWKNI